MAVDIIRIDETTWSFEEPGVRFFLLTGTERALLIDSGMQTRDAKELAEELTVLPLSLLNTHADPDHIGSNDEFDSFRMHPAEGSNYYNSQKRTGTMLPVWDGDIIDLGDRPLRIITLPGHTPGSIAVLDEKNRRIFTGDPVQDGRIFMFGVQRELHAYRHSLLKLRKYQESGRLLLHGIIAAQAGYHTLALIPPLFNNRGNGAITLSSILQQVSEKKAAEWSRVRESMSIALQITEHFPYTYNSILKETIERYYSANKRIYRKLWHSKQRFNIGRSP